jgi:hypothetical protein
MAGNAQPWDASFPKGGIDRSLAFWKQPAKKAPDGTYVKTTRYGKNVRTSSLGTRRRGGQRKGLVRYIDAQVSAERYVVQDLNTVVSIDLEDIPGAEVPQTSLSGRVVQLVAVSQGNVYTAVPGATTWTAATNNTGETPPLNADGVMFSAQNIQKLYFCDGINYVLYAPITDSIELWTASAGTMPEDSDGNYATLICTWRGRTVLSGLLKDPQNIFMSAVNDPTDWDYAPASESATQAVALNLSDMGFIGEAVTCMIPCTDDVLLVGCVNSIRAIRGDPMAGGQVDLISDTVGMVWGQPYAKASDGTIYFFSSRAGIFRVNPTSLGTPVKVSGAIDQFLVDLDTGENHVRMTWDDRDDVLQVFVTPIEDVLRERATHFALETTTGAWWVDILAHKDFDPLACCVLDGNTPGDRVVLIGSWDGYVRSFDPTATDDDGRPIESEVWVGPILTQDTDEVLLLELQAVLGEESGEVAWSVHPGRTGEEAFNADAAVEGTWLAGRGDSEHVRVAGHAIYVKLSGTTPWQLEQVKALVATTGPFRRRSRG